MGRLLVGKDVSARIAARAREGVAELAVRGVVPTLAILRIGERPDDLAYERTAVRRAEALGVSVRQVVLPADVGTDEVLKAVHAVNGDSTIHGCLMFRPMPAGVDERAVCAALAPEKDVDAAGEASLSGVFTESGVGFAPCTAQACVEMLDHYEVPLDGADAVVVGRSLVIGRPVAALILSRNATVTVCHSHTRDLPAKMRAADVVVCATGRAKAYGAACFAPGQVVIDVGMNVDEAGALCGDVDFAAVEPIVDAITPVPRGVGGVTTQVLLDHVVQAALKATA